MRSALRPGPGPGAREGGRSCGRDCRCPAAARGDPDAGCQAPGRDPMTSSPGGGDHAPAEDTGSLLDPCGGGRRDEAQELTRVRRGRADRTRPRSSVRGRREASWGLKRDRVSGAGGGLAQTWKAPTFDLGCSWRALFFSQMTKRERPLHPRPDSQSGKCPFFFHGPEVWCLFVSPRVLWARP